MTWMNTNNTTVNTGMKYNGKDVYKKTIEIQQLANWVKTDEEFIVEAKGMLFNGVHVPLSVVSIGNVITIGQVILPSDKGYIDLLFTKTEANRSPMESFILPSILVTSALIIGYFMKAPELSITFIELFK